jgi:hypothetical protein
MNAHRMNVNWASPGSTVTFKTGHLAGETLDVPDIPQLEEWSWDGVCETPCECRVEPDGSCEHGYSSWLIYCGIC